MKFKITAKEQQAILEQRKLKSDFYYHVTKKFILAKSAIKKIIKYTSDWKPVDSVILYHGTNLFSAINMKKEGMGLNLNDYKNLILDISKEYNIPEAIGNKSFEHWTKHEDINRGEFQGGVSFFQDFKSAKNIASIYAKMGGEWRGHLIDILLKKFARYKKVSFNSNPIKKIYKQVMLKYVGSFSKPVVVKVRIPISFIKNKKDIGKDIELYTLTKVPKKYILEVKEV
ncbi:MAG: hypothetical protein ABH873_01280 [Candidatus Firestonebacteria bacterium]